MQWQFTGTLSGSTAQLAARFVGPGTVHVCHTIYYSRRNVLDYFVWYDENMHKTAAEKIHEAIAAYALRFSEAPALVLVNSTDQTEIGGVSIRSASTVQRNTFWLELRKPVR